MATRKSDSGSNHHPVVRRFVESADTLLVILDELPRPLEPVVAHMLALREAFNLDASGQLEAIRQAEATELEGVDPGLAVIFLSTWAELSHRLMRLDEADALCRRAWSMSGSRAIPEVEAYLLVGEAGTFSIRGKKTEAESCLRRILKILPAGSPRRPLYVFNLARFLANFGRETDVDEEVRELARKIPAVLAADAHYARFVQMVETCRLNEAQELVPQVDLSPERNAFHRPAFGIYQELLAFLAEVFRSGDRPPLEPPAGQASRKIVASWRAMTALLRRDPQEALRLSRQAEKASPGLATTNANLTAFCLLRSELACGNVEAARRIMAQRRELGNLHYLDHLFATRVELLSGNFEAAVRHFAAVTRACRRYRASARLDFELRMACEVSPDALMRLALAAAESKEAAAEPALAPAPARAAGEARLIGNCPAMQALRAVIRQLAPLDAPVLVTGETGTGKELVARALHEESPRKGRPFIAVNCGAIAETLLESELFGHARGAFTGAERERRGIFEEAADGTVLLDEIGEIPPRLQTALLRVLEGGEIRPVGASRARRVACRIVAATNADLPGLVAAGRFRQDLFYRLEHLGISVPPLRERGRDAVQLAGHFLAEGRHDGRRPEMSEGLKQALLHRAWPGNVRELRNVVERMRVMSSDKLAYDLPDLEAAGPAEPAPPAHDGKQAEAGREGAPAAMPPRPERSVIVRLARLRDLFRERGQLRAVEIVRLLGVSAPTVTKDLQSLRAEGLIEKVTPKASPRTHYFRRRVDMPGAPAKES